VHAGTLSNPMPRHRWRIRVFDRSRRITDRPYVVGVILPVAGRLGVFALGASAL
jgi:hypothetical protein